MKKKFNNDKEYMYCVGCKELIEIGEEYVIVPEEILGEVIEKEFHFPCAPEDEEEPYIVKD